MIMKIDVQKELLDKIPLDGCKIWHQLKKTEGWGYNVWRYKVAKKCNEDDFILIMKACRVLLGEGNVFFIENDAMDIINKYRV